MSLTTAVANAAAAAAAGAGRKAAQVQLQAELNNDDEWNKFLHRDGLLVVDVYSEWCGPCLGMVGNLKKIKVEIGGDNLHLAVAKADTIECLKRFRNRSEPTWMFIAAGQLVNVVFGADAPRLARTIEEELRNEELVKLGERERPQRAPHELTPPEQEVASLQEKLRAERKAREESARCGAAGPAGERAARLEVHFADLCGALMMPHAQKHLRKVSETLEPYGVVVADKCPLVLGKQGARLLAAEDEEMSSEATAAAIADRPALALLFKNYRRKKETLLVELARRALYGDGIEQDNETMKKFLSQELHADNVPGLYVPKDRHQRAAVLDLLFPKMVGALVEPPAAAEPPHLALVFGAWQRRAVLSAAAQHCPALLLRYGFFADGDVQEPRLLCKTVEQYEERVEKDYCETIVLMVAVGVADLAFVDPNLPIPDGPPEQLVTLGPLHMSADTVCGEQECARFFPPGYSEPEPKPKAKPKKKKKKRQEVKDDFEDGSRDTAPETVEADGEATADDDGSREIDDGGDGEADGEVDGEGDDIEGDEVEDRDETCVADKATSPPPVVI